MTTNVDYWRSLDRPEAMAIMPISLRLVVASTRDNNFPEHDTSSYPVGSMVRDDMEVDLEADHVPNAIGKVRSKGEEACADGTNKGCGTGIIFCGLPPSACFCGNKLTTYINKNT
jgi:hypothetical protein